MRGWASVDVAPDETKLAELILYVAERLGDDPTGGATKINKILFAAEFTHMRTHGSPITGVEYQKLDHGPAPRRMLPVRDWLIANGDAELVRGQYMGYRLDRLVPKRAPRRDLFTDDEIASVEEAIRELWDKNAVEASRLSHHEMGWRMVATNETIPYEAAFLAPAFEVTDSMRAHAAKLAQKLQR